MAWTLKHKFDCSLGLWCTPNVVLNTAKGICFSPDGNDLYLYGYLYGNGDQYTEIMGGAVVQCLCSSPWGVSYNDAIFKHSQILGDGGTNLSIGALIDFPHYYSLTTCDSGDAWNNYIRSWGMDDPEDVTSILGGDTSSKLAANGTVMGFATFPASSKHAELDRASRTLYLYAPLVNLDWPWEFLESYTLDDCEGLSGIHVASDESYILTVDQTTKRIIKITLPTPGSLAGASHKTFKDFSTDQDDIAYSGWDIWDITSNPECTLVTLVVMSPEITSGYNLQPFVVATYSLTPAFITPVPWPSILPAPLREGLKITPNPDVKVRDTQSGRKELRRWGAGKGDTLTCTLRLRKNHPTHGDQVAEFRRYWRHDLNCGLNWIDAPWLAAALGYADHYVRITGYVPRKGNGAIYSDYTINFTIQKKANCWETTTWPS